MTITTSAASERLLTAQEVADYLGVTPDWVYAQSRRGSIPTVPLGRYRRYRLDAVKAWIAALEQNEQDPRRTGARP